MTRAMDTDNRTHADMHAYLEASVEALRAEVKRLREVIAEKNSEIESLKANVQPPLLNGPSVWK